MAIKYVPIRSERSFRRHKAAGARFEVNSKGNMRPRGHRSKLPNTYWCPACNSGWITPLYGVEGAREHLRKGTMAVRAVYYEA